MWTIDWPSLYFNKPTAKPGITSIQGDEWPHASPIIEGDDQDVQLFGTNLRYCRNDGIVDSLPAKVELTGRKVYVESSMRKLRCRITTWDSNEDPVSFLGWLYLWSNYE